MNEKELVTYYNKFNEDKRLNTKHGMIEFKTSLKYIHDYLNNIYDPKIIDIGAGTGKYSIYLSDEGYDVTAVELVLHNLRVLQSKNKKIKSYQGNALDLSIFGDNTFDLTLLFGPMYHLITMEEKIKALNEAKRITKPNGIIMISYCMNEYAVITHGFIDSNIVSSIENNKLDNGFHILSDPKELYSFVRLDDINYLNETCKLKRLKAISQDGPSEYIKKVINKMNDEEFELFYKYHLSICEKPELLGSGRHMLDIVTKE